MRVATPKLSEGMVLDADVVDQKGRVLARRGAALTERAVQGLRAWGVVAVQIQGQAGGADAAHLDDPQHLAEVERRFSAANLDLPLMAELKRLALGRPRGRL